MLQFLFCFFLPWCGCLCSLTLIPFNNSSPPWQKEQRHPGFLEVRHEIISELAGHRHDSEHLFISSRNDHNRISIAMHRAKTKLLWPITGPLGPGSMSGFAVAALWGSWGLPQWAAGSCAGIGWLLYKYIPPSVGWPAPAGWHSVQTQPFLFMLYWAEWPWLHDMCQ